MKRIAVVLVILFLMSVSFAVIGGVILYATGTVSSVDELKSMVSGTERQPKFVQDALEGAEVLEQHKSEIERQLDQTRKKIEVLKKLSEIIASSTGTEADQAEAQRQAAGLVAGLDPATAADVLGSLDDDTTVRLLSAVPEENATGILDAMDAERRTRLIGRLTRK